MEPCFGTLYSMGTLPPESDASAGRCQPKIGRGFHDAVTFRRGRSYSILVSPWYEYKCCTASIYLLRRGVPSCCSRRRTECGGAKAGAEGGRDASTRAEAAACCARHAILWRFRSVS